MFQVARRMGQDATRSHRPRRRPDDSDNQVLSGRNRSRTVQDDSPTEGHRGGARAHRPSRARHRRRLGDRPRRRARARPGRRRRRRHAPVARRHGRRRRDQGDGPDRGVLPGGPPAQLGRRHGGQRRRGGARRRDRHPRQQRRWPGRPAQGASDGRRPLARRARPEPLLGVLRQPGRARGHARRRPHHHDQRPGGAQRRRHGDGRLRDGQGGDRGLHPGARARAGTAADHGERRRAGVRHRHPAARDATRRSLRSAPRSSRPR